MLVGLRTKKEPLKSLTFVSTSVGHRTTLIKQERNGRCSLLYGVQTVKSQKPIDILILILNGDIMIMDHLIVYMFVNSCYGTNKLLYDFCSNKFKKPTPGGKGGGGGVFTYISITDMCRPPPLLHLTRT